MSKKHQQQGMYKTMMCAEISESDKRKSRRCDEVYLENVVGLMNGVPSKMKFENIPDVAPVSDTSAGSSSPSCNQARSNASDISDATSVKLAEVDAVAWEEAESSPKRERRKIHWGTVETRHYPVIPGDHPDTFQGPPVSLDSL